MHKYYIGYTFLFLLLLFTSSCNSDIPATESLFVFKFKSNVDARALKCGYHDHEKCSDEQKKKVRKDVGEISTTEQISLGDSFHMEIPYSISDDKMKARLIKRIINKMSPFLSNKELNHDSFVLDSPEFNAFTIPGGNIYITTGLIDAVENEDALAYIIGHELGHNENNHTKEGARLYKYLQKRKEGFWNLVGGIWTKLRSDYCNQSDEIEADITGIYLAYKAGYNPELALSGLELLKQLDIPKPEGRLKKWLIDMLRTHPWSEDRYNCVKNYVKSAKTKVECEKIYSNKNGEVITKKGPLNIREYPNLNASKLDKLSRGTIVKLICDCVTQNNDKKFIYIKTKSGIKGWVDGKYIKEK